MIDNDGLGTTLKVGGDMSVMEDMYLEIFSHFCEEFYTSDDVIAYVKSCNLPLKFDFILDSSHLESVFELTLYSISYDKQSDIEFSLKLLAIVYLFDPMKTSKLVFQRLFNNLCVLHEAINTNEQEIKALAYIVYRLQMFEVQNQSVLEQFLSIQIQNAFHSKRMESGLILTRFRDFIVVKFQFYLSHFHRRLYNIRKQSICSVFTWYSSLVSVPFDLNSRSNSKLFLKLVDTGFLDYNEAINSELSHGIYCQVLQTVITIAQQFYHSDNEMRTLSFQVLISMRNLIKTSSSEIIGLLFEMLKSMRTSDEPDAVEIFVVSQYSQESPFRLKLNFIADQYQMRYATVRLLTVCSVLSLIEQDLSQVSFKIYKNGCENTLKVFTFRLNSNVEIECRWKPWENDVDLFTCWLNACAECILVSTQNELWRLLYILSDLIDDNVLNSAFVSTKNRTKFDEFLELRSSCEQILFRKCWSLVKSYRVILRAFSLIEQCNQEFKSKDSDLQRIFEWIQSAFGYILGLTNNIPFQLLSFDELFRGILHSIFHPITFEHPSQTLRQNSILEQISLQISSQFSYDTQNNIISLINSQLLIYSQLHQNPVTSNALKMIQTSLLNQLRPGKPISNQV